MLGNLELGNIKSCCPNFRDLTMTLLGKSVSIYAFMKACMGHLFSESKISADNSTSKWLSTSWAKGIGIENSSRVYQATF